LTFFGDGGSLFTIYESGEVRIASAHALKAVLVSDDGSVTIPVSVTDGIVTVASALILDKPYRYIDQSEIYVRTTDGTEYAPETADDLIAVLQAIQATGGTIDELIIKGHGGADIDKHGQPVDEPNFIEVGDDGENLRVDSSVGTHIMIGSEDVTQLLRSITTNETEISLRGCFTYPLALELQTALGTGANVYGSSFFTIGIPGTLWAFGFYD